MTSTTTTLAGTQVRLPGQTAAHEGPVDMVMMYVAHHAFRRDLALLARAVPVTPVDAHDTWTAMAERFEAFSTVLHLHHSGEDSGLWPLLLERVDAVGDATGRATLEAMEAEHAGIDPLLGLCGDGLRRMAAGGTADERAALAVRCAAARDLLARHLEHEETEAIALIQRHLTQEDWSRMEEEHFKAHQLPFRQTLFLVPWFCEGVPSDVRRRAFAEAGRGLAVLLVLTRRRFARHAARAFAYA